MDTAAKQIPILARVLVIEDEHPMRLALHDCLVAEGYRVLPR